MEYYSITKYTVIEVEDGVYKFDKDFLFSETDVNDDIVVFKFVDASTVIGFSQLPLEIQEIVEYHSSGGLIKLHLNQNSYRSALFIKFAEEVKAKLYNHLAETNSSCLNMVILNCKNNGYMSYSAEVSADRTILNAEVCDGLKKHNPDANIVIRVVRFRDSYTISFYWNYYDWSVSKEEFEMKFGAKTFEKFLNILQHYRQMPADWFFKIKNLCRFAESIIKFRETEVENV